MNSADMNAALQSNNPTERNRAFKTLYMSPIVNGKIFEWAKLYNLRDKTADDVLQEGIILLEQMIRDGRFRFESKAQTFLLGICKNLIRDSSKKVSRVVFKDSIPESALSSEDELADYLELQSPGEKEEKRDLALSDALQQLTPKCQEALKLYYFEQKSMAEVAKARELANADQAKKAMSRCRESLREIITNDKRFQHLLA